MRASFIDAAASALALDGEHWAIIASLIETCKLCDVEPYAYLADVITKIVNRHPIARSTSSCSISPHPRSRPWPENVATFQQQMRDLKD